jgi:hypothetical protein
MLEIQVTKQEFKDFMDSEIETAGVFTDDALELLYDHLLYRDDDAEMMSKKKIIKEWEEYENREAAEKGCCAVSGITKPAVKRVIGWVK